MDEAENIWFVIDMDLFNSEIEGKYNDSFQEEL